MSKKTIVLFQQDFRLSDNAALTYAAKRGEVIPVYIFDDMAGDIPLGGASKWWLYHSLSALQKSFKELGVRLILRKGERISVVEKLLQESSADAVYWNRIYQPKYLKEENTLKNTLEKKNIEVKIFHASLLFEPWTIKNKQGSFFKIFTPFWKYCLTLADDIGNPYPVPKLTPSTHTQPYDDLKRWGLLPTNPDWSTGFKIWQPGEQSAQQRLHFFLDNLLDTYPKNRDIPCASGTSSLSPHIHWGEISPRQLYNATRFHEARLGKSQAAEKFLCQLFWREFSHYLLYHIPDLVAQPFNPKFKNFPWLDNDAALRAWQRGKTGYPLVDAGMHELRETGYMHNRVRMVVASFLTKHLQIHWKHGAAWFWDNLLDADLANNIASWQWVAGCGADAAPYYRIFNPVLQGQRFDPSGVYIKRWLPQLANLSPEHIHCPWQADAQILRSAGVILGENYPYPIVDHVSAREAAILAYKSATIL